MKNKTLKEMQRNVNYIVKAMNKSLFEDDLWKGRFAIKQTKRIDQYVDYNFYACRYFFKLIDKATGKETETCFAFWTWADKKHIKGFITSKLFMAMNEFIIEDCKVWEENPRPNIRTSKDYREVKI